MTKKLAIIGANCFQLPLVEKAKQMNIYTICFAWEDGAVCKKHCDKFYPVSIFEKEKILEICQEERINGITSIASDIAMPTVNYIAKKLDLVGNSVDATLVSTDKFEMRKALKSGGIPCPDFECYTNLIFPDNVQMVFPVIVKPTDRSGSRGVTMVEKQKDIDKAFKKAYDCSIMGKVIIEECIVGREYSVEMISYKGTHYHLAITDKVTTGAPYFIEIEHHQPAQISREKEELMIKTVKKALDLLQIKNGASHSEVFIDTLGKVKIGEIAGRMGGDFIGSDMVLLSTGYDFVQGVINIALGEFDPINYKKLKNEYSGVYCVLPNPGLINKIINNRKNFTHITKAIPILQVGDQIDSVIDASGKRAGIFVYCHPNKKLKFNPIKVLIFKT